MTLQPWRRHTSPSACPVCRRTVDPGRPSGMSLLGAPAAAGGRRRPDVRRRGGRAGRAGAAGRLAAAARRRGRRGRPGPGARRPAARRRQRDRGRPACWPPGPSWSTYVRRPRRSAWNKGAFLHAGPPIGWDRASGPLRGALIGAMVYEGLADTPEDAERRSRAPAAAELHWEPVPPPPHRRADGRRGEPVDVDVRAARPGARRRPPSARSTRGSGKVLRYGAYGPEVIERLRWMSDVLGPLLQTAVRARTDAGGPVDVKAIAAQMLQMGDEGHNRNRAGTLMFLRELLPSLIDSGAPTVRRRRGGALRLRQRPLLPQPRHAGLQAGRRRGARRARVVAGRRDGAQRHRLRHPGVGHRRPVVHRPGQHAGRALPRRPSGRTTPTPTSATRRSPRPAASAASRWRRPRRS